MTDPIKALLGSRRGYAVLRNPPSNKGSRLRRLNARR